MTEQLTIYSRIWPQQFLADFERVGTALWLYLYLLTRRNPKTGYARGSFQRVAEELGVSVQELRRWLDELEQAGYLVDESLDGRMILKVEGE